LYKKSVSAKIEFCQKISISPHSLKAITINGNDILFLNQINSFKKIRK